MRRVLQVRSAPRGEIIDGVRRNEWLTALAFGGRRNRAYRELVALSEATAGERVIDVGCGRGYLVRRLSALVGPTGSVVGVDPSARAVDLAGRDAPVNCTFVLGAAQQLEFEDGSFDLVTSTLAVHHIPEAERQSAFLEFYRVLRPGGRMLVADFGNGRSHVLSRHGTAHQGETNLGELVERAGFTTVREGDVRKVSYITGVRQ